ncbi:MAG: CPBP family intramembrane glutamic endopeptidase [Chloroflexota bacterium]
MTESEVTNGKAAPRVLATAVVPFGLLLTAAVVGPLRPPLLAALAIGWVVVRALSPRHATAWAATLPVAAILAWASVYGRDIPLGAAACSNPLSTIALSRVLEATGVLTIVVVLAFILRVRPADIGLRGADHGILAAAVGIAVLAAVGGLVIGPVLAAPFFGEVSFAMPAAAIVPALIFGVTNGVMEEVAYRGWLQSHLRPFVGAGGAIVLQGVTFGIAHAGPEVVGPLALHVAQMSAAGIVAGVFAQRFGLLPVIAVHIGADVALYFGLACSAAPP